jgi:hypothetical protein
MTIVRVLITMEEAGELVRKGFTAPVVLQLYPGKKWWILTGPLFEASSHPSDNDPVVPLARAVVRTSLLSKLEERIPETSLLSKLEARIPETEIVLRWMAARANCAIVEAEEVSQPAAPPAAT